VSPLSLRCVRFAFAFLAMGVGLGVAFAANRGIAVALRPLHAELNHWGFATLLVYGMAFHVLPRFAGRPLRWPRLADAQSWLAMAGVGVTSAGLVLAHAGSTAAGGSLAFAGAVVQAVAALVFTLLVADLAAAPARA
jgi:hypothetical protein